MYVSEILHNEIAAYLSDLWLLFGWKLNKILLKIGWKLR